MISIFMMMMSLTAAVEVTIAPDQPMPFVYVDDPLIIEIVSDLDVAYDAKLVLQAAHTDGRIELDLGRIELHANAAYWHAVHDAPSERGCYNAEVVLTAGDAIERKTGRFCRIDRPNNHQLLPIVAYCSGEKSACALTAIRSVGIQTVHFSADNEYLNVLADDATLLGFHLVLGVTAQHAKNLSDQTSDIIQARCEHVLRFDMDCVTVKSDCVTPVDALRQEGCPAGISLVVHAPGEFETLLLDNPGLSTRHVSLCAPDWPEHAAVQELRAIALRNGLEGWQVHVAGLNWRPKGNDKAAQFIHRYCIYRAMGVQSVGLNASVIADDVGVQEMMSYLNGLAVRFQGKDFVGMLPADNGVYCPLFRSGASWLAVIWSDSPSGALIFPMDGAVNIALTDALGNTLPVPESENGAVKLNVGREPLYLTASGGVVFGRAAVSSATTMANGIAQMPGAADLLLPAGQQLLQKIASEPKGTGSRLRYLDLLRMIPMIEEQWHTRKTTKQVAVPLISAICELSRALCIVEEDRAELFLEPLSDTLARSEELQSLYLTGSAGTAQSRERGDWLLGEVRRLVDEAEALDAVGRKIEASALAALAEARAQCLKPAAQAIPITETVPDMKAIAAPTPVVAADTNAQAAPEGEGEKAATQKEEGASAKKDAKKETPKSEKEKTSASGEYKEIVHKVVSGDNPYSIAKKYKVSLDDFMKWNNLTKKSRLNINQELIVRVKP